MSMLQMSKLIGTTAQYRVKGLVIDVTIVDIVDSGWCRYGYKIKPVSGGDDTITVLESSLNFNRKDTNNV